MTTEVMSLSASELAYRENNLSHCSYRSTSSAEYIPGPSSNTFFFYLTGDTRKLCDVIGVVTHIPRDIVAS